MKEKYEEMFSTRNYTHVQHLKYPEDKLLLKLKAKEQCLASN